MTLPLLLQRVREASGNFGPWEAEELLTDNTLPWEPYGENDKLFVAALQGDLTAAVALVERVRPGQAGVVSFGQVWSRTDFINAGDRVQLHETCRTPALSMVACLLASLTQEARDGVHLPRS